MTDLQTLTSSARDKESVAAFVQWAAAALQQASAPGQGGGSGPLVAPLAPIPPLISAPQPSAAPPLPAAPQLSVAPQVPAAPRLTAEASLAEPLRWLASLREQAAPILFEATPVGDVQYVRELSPRILGAYHARQGHVELAGCTLEPRPFLRLTFQDVQPDRLGHVWFGGDGQRIDADLTRRLGLAQLQPAAARLRPGDRATIEQWIAAALAANQPVGEVSERAVLADVSRLLAATVTWCRWAAGKVAISFGDRQRVEIPFDGWAADYRAGYLLPPPYRCAESGLTSHNVCVLEDGTATVAEALGRCEQSSTEVLATRLGTCEVTGRRALRDLMVRCQISGRRILAEAADQCQWCGRQVAPDELQEGRCGDCRGGTPIAAHDPLLQQLLAEDAALGRYKRWRGWRDERVAVLVGSRWAGDVVVICDASDGRVQRRGHRGRLLRRWNWL